MREQMNDVIVKVKRDNKGIPIPTYVTPGSAGCDVTAAQSCILVPGERYLMPTGLFLEVPEGYECQIRPRSGLALQHGITVLNTPGTCDSDFRGEVCVLLINHGVEWVNICLGERIAQLVFAPVTQVKFEVVEELTESDRGTGGFGSTGK